ncbi:MAG: cysteine hydrolase family protein [Succinivibrio sp.]
MNQNSFCSIYYADGIFERLENIDKATTALLVIDLQNSYRTLGRTPETARFASFASRLDNTVIPNVKRLLNKFRDSKMPVLYCAIACHLKDGSDRSLSQKLPGWNSVLMHKKSYESKIIDEIAPCEDEIVLTKTTDSALTGTNLRLLLNNLGIKTVVCAGIFTDQCVASTVRSLSDESFHVIVAEDGCAAGSMELHNAELTILNHIYCTVSSADEIIGLIDKQH